ncbi:hypothetical protein PCE1_004691 [Barthelona sp. PCE]
MSEINSNSRRKSSRNTRLIEHINEIRDIPISWSSFIAMWILGPLKAMQSVSFDELKILGVALNVNFRKIDSGDRLLAFCYIYEELIKQGFLETTSNDTKVQICNATTQTSSKYDFVTDKIDSAIRNAFKDLRPNIIEAITSQISGQTIQPKVSIPITPFKTSPLLTPVLQPPMTMKKSLSSVQQQISPRNSIISGFQKSSSLYNDFMNSLQYGCFHQGRTAEIDTETGGFVDRIKRMAGEVKNRMFYSENLWRPIKEYGAHVDGVSSVNFINGDRKQQDMLVSSSADHTVCFWQPDTGAFIHRQRLPAPIVCADVSQSSKMILCGLGNGNLSLVDYSDLITDSLHIDPPKTEHQVLFEGEPEFRPTIFEESNCNIKLSNICLNASHSSLKHVKSLTDVLIATSGKGTTAVKVWDMRSSSCVCTIPLSTSFQCDDIAVLDRNSFAISSSNASSGEMSIVDLRHPDLVVSRFKQGPRAVMDAYVRSSIQKATIASVDSNGFLHLFDVRMGDPLKTVKLDIADSSIVRFTPHKCRFSPLGRLAVAFSKLVFLFDNPPTLSGFCESTFKSIGHRRAITDVCFGRSPDDLYTASLDNILLKWAPINV